MTLPRTTLVDPSTTLYYHCVSRCVRRAYLCGTDSASGRSFEHRRAWIRGQVVKVASVFSVEVCAYAIMSNHHHLVLKLDPQAAADWPEDEVLERWCRLFSGPLLIQRLRAGERLSEAERRRVSEWAEVYRARLCDLSWFMRCINEPIARWANAEDGCTGRFREGRFKSQALLEEQALLSCMAYVDLNPIRAGMAETPETSDFTSLQQRIEGFTVPAADSAADEPNPWSKPSRNCSRLRVPRRPITACLSPMTITWSWWTGAAGPSTPTSGARSRMTPRRFSSTSASTRTDFCDT